MSKLTEQGMPEEDLSDLGAPVRGAGLAGLITPPPDDALDDVRPAVPSAAPPRRRSTPSVTGDERRPRRPGRPRVRTKPAMAVYVSPGVKQRFDAYRHRTKSTNLQVILNAISSVHEQLETIIGQSEVSTAPVDPLFPADPSAVKYLGGGSVQIAFSPTAEQEAVLDRLGNELGITTRSTWIAPVLNAFLPGRKEEAAS